ncbi:collectin-10 isoform X4 [Coturnix japonica]|uniref:collectin-10 isoform X4 n=1 Tax=Coturnix japonica TaxID=93934 RepID=UPI00077753A6|nr:collectin-10 isoform X4 [Coturnix japonica]
MSRKKEQQLRKYGTLVVLFIFQVQIFGFDVDNRPTTDVCSTHTILPGPKGNKGTVGDVGDQGMLGKIGPIGGKGTVCDCGRYRRVVGQLNINVARLNTSIKFVKNVIAGIRETDEKFYYIVKEEKNYREALMHCKDRGGTLAMPKGEVINALLADYISSSGLFRAFIGINDMEKEGQFVYADSSPLQNYSNWKDGEPHDSTGHEDCVEMLSTGEWNDSECQVTIYFICEFLKKRK